MGWRVLWWEEEEEEEEATAEFLFETQVLQRKDCRTMGQGRAGVVQTDLGFWGRIPGWISEHWGLRGMQTN